MTGNAFDKAARKLALSVPFFALIIGAGMLAASMISALSSKDDAAAVSATPGDERRYTVVVDAGHGGEDGGAVSPNGTVESTLNLSYANALKSELEALGICVVLTRENEDALARGKREDMAARREIMNAEGVDAVVSIHMNKFRDSSVSGPMAFYMKGSAEGEALASEVIVSVSAALGREKRLANPGDYYVIRESVPPAVIVECGFLSNADDEALLITEEHRQKLARAIAEGTRAFLGKNTAQSDG